MSHIRKLKVLPSAVDGTDGTENVLDQWPENEREALKEEICRKAGQRLSTYYSMYPKEWENFVKTVLQDES